MLKGAKTVSRKSILIVDDDKVILRRLIVQCKQLRLDVRIAVNEEMTFQNIRDRQPDVILLDVTLTDGDGLAICNALAEDTELRNIPLIVHSGRSDTETRAHCEKLGARYILKSPHSWREIETQLNDIFKNGMKKAS